jgi:hypothetical protein
VLLFAFCSGPSAMLPCTSIAIVSFVPSTALSARIAGAQEGTQSAAKRYYCHHVCDTDPYAATKTHRLTLERDDVAVVVGVVGAAHGTRAVFLPCGAPVYQQEFGARGKLPAAARCMWMSSGLGELSESRIECR